MSLSGFRSSGNPAKCSERSSRSCPPCCRWWCWRLRRRRRVQMHSSREAGRPRPPGRNHNCPHHHHPRRQSPPIRLGFSHRDARCAFWCAHPLLRRPIAMRTRIAGAHPRSAYSRAISSPRIVATSSSECPSSVSERSRGIPRALPRKVRPYGAPRRTRRPAPSCRGPSHLRQCLRLSSCGDPTSIAPPCAGSRKDDP